MARTDNNVLAIAQKTAKGYKYTVAGVRSAGWLENNVRRYNYLWVVATGDGENIDRNIFGLSGTITAARRNAKRHENEDGNKAQFFPIHLIS